MDTVLGSQEVSLFVGLFVGCLVWLCVVSCVYFVCWFGLLHYVWLGV